MMRTWTAAFASLLLLAILSTSRVAAAEDKVTRLSKQLSSSEDFRVRTQAALALGASKSKRAVTPLCKGLNDSNTTVRAAAAAALGKLALGGKTCLSARYGKESSKSVKSVIKNALKRFDSDESGPAIRDDTRYYISIGKTTDNTGRDVHSMVRSAMVKAISDLGGYAVAPSSEGKSAAAKLFGKHKKLKGFYLVAKVEPPQYSDGKLSVKVSGSIFTYPEKSLKAFIPGVKVSLSGVSGKDRASEDDLIKAAAERIVKKFSENVEKFE